MEFADGSTSFGYAFSLYVSDRDSLQADTGPNSSYPEDDDTMQHMLTARPHALATRKADIPSWLESRVPILSMAFLLAEVPMFLISILVFQNHRFILDHDFYSAHGAWMRLTFRKRRTNPHTRMPSTGRIQQISILQTAVVFVDSAFAERGTAHCAACVTLDLLTFSG